MKLYDDIKDRWIIWCTSKSCVESEWEEWYNTNVNIGANDITNMFENFKHVIAVNSDRFLCDGGIGWVPHSSAKQYSWHKDPG